MYFVHNQCVHCPICGTRCPWHHECASAADREYVVISLERGDQSSSVEFHDATHEQVDMAATYQPNVDHVSRIFSSKNFNFSSKIVNFSSKISTFCQKLFIFLQKLLIFLQKIVNFSSKISVFPYVLSCHSPFSTFG